MKSCQQLFLKSKHCASGATCCKHCCTLDAGWMDVIVVSYYYCCCTTAVTIITSISLHLNDDENTILLSSSVRNM